jgi:polyisoprenyl-phosphate glycosyltransferase
MTNTIAIVTPVLDDWESFTALVEEISHQFTGCGAAFRIYAVDDGSVGRFDLDRIVLPADSCIVAIEVIRLAANLGHQRAIAIGLCATAEIEGIESVVVMDSDGQDRPADIAALLAADRRHPLQVVLAARAKRSETRSFRLCYRAYKLMFHLLTGQTISFGNFCLIPGAAVGRFVHMPELWNSLAAAIMRSRLPYMTVPTARGRRFAGHSKMNVVSLILHGLSAMSVHVDRIFVRVLLAAAITAGTATLAIIAVAVIRVATDLAIPGWATTAVGDLLIILFQIRVIVVAASLTMLAGRSSRPIVPIVDCRPLIAGRERCRFERRIPVTADSGLLR